MTQPDKSLSERVEALKPCPFCGGTSSLVAHDGRTTSKHYTAHVWCGNCEVSQDICWGNTQENASGNAIKNWNMRPMEEQLQRELADKQRENQRLRETLQKIAYSHMTPEKRSYWNNTYEWMEKVAKEALATTGAGEVGKVEQL